MRGWKMKGAWGFVLLLLFFGWDGPSDAVVDRVVAIVNQEAITLSELEKWRGAYQDQIQVEDRLEKRIRTQEVWRKVLDQLIEEKLIDQEVKRAGLKVTAKEMEGALDEIKRRNGITQEELVKALAKEGTTLEALKNRIEKQILRSRFISHNVKVEPNAGEKELRDFYQANLDRYRAAESYRPGHILFHVPKDATPEQVRETRKKSQGVLQKIRKGDDFRELALLYSEDASAKDGGDLGIFKKGELIPGFEKEALRLQVGEVSDIVRTDFGFHIIKLLDRTGGNPIPFGEVKEKVRADYYEKAMDKALRQFLAALREKSVIELKL
jgi:peptidyl-prolyl cis-trans isomerase SurA